MIGIREGSWEGRCGTKWRYKKKSAGEKENCNTNLDVVHEVHHKYLWEFHFALVGTNKVQILGYKLILGSCDLAQWLWRYGHSKSVIPLQQFCHTMWRLDIATILELTVSWQVVNVTILFLGSALFLISSFCATSPFLGSLSYAYHHYLLILGPLTFTIHTL